MPTMTTDEDLRRRMDEDLLAFGGPSTGLELDVPTSIPDLPTAPSVDNSTGDSNITIAPPAAAPAPAAPLPAAATGPTMAPPPPPPPPPPPTPAPPLSPEKEAFNAEDLAALTADDRQFARGFTSTDPGPRREGESVADYNDRTMGAGNWAFSQAGPSAPTAATAASTPKPDLTTQLEQTASTWLDNPNRFMSDLVTKTRESGDQRRQLAREAAGRDMDEWVSQRGLVGSNIEGDAKSDLSRKLSADLSAEELALQDMLAKYESMDKLAAGEFGRDVSGQQQQNSQFEQGLGISQQEVDLRAEEIRTQAGLEGRSLNLQESRDQATREIQLGQLGISQQDIGLRAKALQQDYELEGRSLTLQESRDEAQREFQLGQLGVSKDELKLRATELQQQAALEGRSLDLQEARDQASTELRREELDTQLQLQTNELTQRESEYARGLGLDEKKFIADQDQFSKEFALDEESVRGGRNVTDPVTGVTTWVRTSEMERFAIDAGMRERALDLQESGQDAEAAWRQAALDSEEMLETSRQALVKIGMTNDDAYRYAALNQDSGFRDRALDLQKEEMDADAGFRQSAQELQEAVLKGGYEVTNPDGTKRFIQTADEAYRQAEREFLERAETTRAAQTRLTILVQALDALQGWGGLTGSAADIIKQVMADFDVPDLPHSGGGSPDYPGGGGDGGGGGTDEPPPQGDEESDAEYRARLAREADANG